VLGNEKTRRLALLKEADIYLINRENVEWLVSHLGASWSFDMVVVDELSSFKSAKARRFRSLRLVKPYIKRFVGLTGTPAPNGLLDLWSQIYLLDSGERLGKTITMYRDKYFTEGRRNGHIIFEWKPKPEAEKRIYEKLSDICISMKAVDWINVPKRIDNVISVELSDADREAYKLLERERLLPFLDADVTADNAASLSNKLLQLANGAIYDENKDVQFVHDAKLTALEDVVESANGKPILVFYNYKHDLSRIRGHFKALCPSTLDTPDDIRKWNSGNTQMLLAHPASAGHGLNLQAGGHIIVWFGLTWSLELYEQANARLHRQGQQESVIVHHLVAKDTIDEDVMEALKNKSINQNALMNAVKAKIYNIKTNKV
jgi:SNF2 family DNA or RNA helicase